MNMDIAATILTQIGTLALVGFLFWAYLNARFQNVDDKMDMIFKVMNEHEETTREIKSLIKDHNELDEARFNRVHEKIDANSNRIDLIQSAIQSLKR